MKKYLFASATILLLLVTSSCQKEDSSGDDTGTQPDNTALDRMVILDTTYASGMDTLYKYEFTYDAQKRPSKIKITGFIEGTRDVEYQAVENRFYNGSNMNPYKITAGGTPDYPDDISTENYLTYNASQVVTIDSALLFFQGNKVDVKRQAYIAKSPTRYLVERASYDPVTNSLNFKDTTYANVVFTGKNLTSASDSSYSENLGGLYQVNRYTCTFDSKKNAASKLRIPVPVNYFSNGDDGALSLINMLSSNNITSMSTYIWTSTAGGRTEIVNSSYEYNANGYPVIIRYPGLDGSKRKDYLFYRTL